MALLAAGQDESAARSSANTKQQIAHHIQQTLDEIDAIADACIDALDPDDDGGLIEEIEAARKKYRRVLLQQGGSSSH